MSGESTLKNCVDLIVIVDESWADHLTPEAIVTLVAAFMTVP